MYANWETKALLIHPFEWIAVIDLLNYLHELRDYIVRTPGKLSETYLPILPESRDLFSDRVRFPPNRNFLCEGYGEWKVIFDMLQLSVNVMIYKNRLDRNYPPFKTAGGAEMFALEKINELFSFLHLPEHNYVMNQRAFEKYFGLVWEEN